MNVIQVPNANGKIIYVEVKGTPEEAKGLFHDMNRLLSLLDVMCPKLPNGEGEDTGDQAAYDRVNGFLALMLLELKIEPEDG